MDVNAKAKELVDFKNLSSQMEELFNSSQQQCDKLSSQMEELLNSSQQQYDELLQSFFVSFTQTSNDLNQIFVLRDQLQRQRQNGKQKRSKK